MAEEDVVVKFGANTTELNSVLTSVVGTLGGATNAMASQLGAVNLAANATRMAMSALIGVIGSVVSVSTAIAAFGRATEETRGLAGMLGIAADEASILRASLDDVGISSEGYLGVIQRMTMRLREKKDRFTELGITIKDQNGLLLDNQQILMNTLTRIDKFKAGTDRNLISQELIGRGYKVVNDLLRMTPELLQANAEWAARFGQVLNNEDIAAFRKFELASNDTKDALEGFQLTLARGFMPLLQHLADSLNSQLPGAFSNFKVVLGGVVIIAEALYIAFYAASAVVVNFIGIFADMFTSMGLAIADLAHGDWRLALKDMEAGFNGLHERVGDVMYGIEDEVGKSVQRIRDMYKKPIVEPTTRGGTDTYTPPQTGQEEKVIAEWVAELQRMKDRSDDILGLALASEAEFWIARLLMVKEGTKSYEAALHNLADVRKRIAADELSEEESKFRNELFLANKNTDEKLAIYDKWLALIETKYGRDHARYRDLEQQKTAVLRQQLEERRSLELMYTDAITTAKVAEINRERELLRGASSMDLVSGQERVARLRELENQEYEIRREGLLRKRDMEGTSATDRAQAEAELAGVIQEHNLSVLRSNNDMLDAIRDKWDTIFSAISSTISTSIQGMILGTTTFKQAWNSLMTNILASFVDMGVKLLLRWIANEIAMTTATTAGVAVRTAAEQAGASQSVLVQAGAAVKNILNSAWEAAAAAFKAIAGIPFVGPALAVGASIAAFAAVAGLIGNIVSSEGGWDVPGGGGMAVLHPREMVLPEKLANVIRQSADGEGGAGGGSYTFNVSAIDADGVRKFFRDNAPALVSQLRKLNREFVS